MRIKELLKEKNITAKELAQKLNLSEGALSQSINKNPTLERLRQIADALGVGVAELFVDEHTSDKLVAFFHFKGESHLPTTIDEVMAVLTKWNEEEFHKVCHSIAFNHIRDKYEGDIVIQELLVSLCSLLHNYGDPNYLCEKKHTKGGNAK